MEKIRLGIIGGGIGSYIGKAHRIAACMDENYTLIGGIFSSTYQKSLELANNLNLDTKRIYEDIDSFIKGELALPEKERIEAVTIAVPNHLHYEIAKKLIENKFHVICEKPVTNTSIEAVELEELVKKSKVIFCLTHTYTGYPMVRELKKLIEKDMIGKIQRVHAQYYEGCWNPFIHDKESRKGIWRFDPEKTGISCTMADIGVHAFNLIEYVTGLKVTSVLADLNTLYDDNPLDVDGTVLPATTQYLETITNTPWGGNDMKFGVFYETDRPTKNQLEQQWIDSSKEKVGDATPKDMLATRFAAMK